MFPNSWVCAALSGGLTHQGWFTALSIQTQNMYLGDTWKRKEENKEKVNCFRGYGKVTQK